MSVPGLERGIAILRLFRRDRAELTASQIANELEIPRSTTHRLLMELVGLGLLRRMDDSRYSLDAGVLTIGYEYLSSISLPEIAAPFLGALRDTTNWSSHLAVRRDQSVIYLSRFPSRAAVTRNIAVGTSLPAHATLMGRVLLSDLEPMEVRHLYDGFSFDDEEDHEAVPSDLSDILRLTAQDRGQRALFSDGFYERGVRVVAAPLRDSSLRAVAAINATAVGEDCSPIADVIDAVTEIAGRISRLLGAPDIMPHVAEQIMGDTKWG